MDSERKLLQLDYDENAMLHNASFFTHGLCADFPP